MFFKKIGFVKDYIAGIREGVLTSYRLKRIDFDKEMHKRCLMIELELIANTFVYVKDYLDRRSKKESWKSDYRWLKIIKNILID